LLSPGRPPPRTGPFIVEPVSSVSVFAPTPANVIAKLACPLIVPPVIVPAFVTEPGPPAITIPILTPALIVPPD